MKKNLPALAIAALALAGCASAQADETRVTGSASFVTYAVGSTDNSVDEVREALESDALRVTVHDNLDALLSKSEDFGTSFEFERDLFVCEMLHPIPADHAPDHPESKPLADCTLGTYRAFDSGRP